MGISEVYFICIFVLLIINIQTMRHLTIKKFRDLLKSRLLDNPNYHISDDDPTLADFPGIFWAEVGIQERQRENFGIYLAFTYHKKQEKFFEQLFTEWPTLIPTLKDYLIPLFSENTNDDACSFSISFNTDHLNTEEGALWEITMTVTDFYS
jgi:hypothetical protein